jgi:hypothetical protein
MSSVRRLVCFIALCMALAGCSTNSRLKASTTPTTPVSSVSTPSARPTATPTRTGPLTTGEGVKPGEIPPAFPEQANNADSSGPISFGAYFVAALDWSLATTDPYLLRQISASTCEPCSTYVDGLSELAANGGYVIGGRATFLSSSISTGSLVTADAVVDVKFSQTAEIIYKPGVSASSYPAPPGVIVNRLYLKRLDLGWAILDIGIPPA